MARIHEILEIHDKQADGTFAPSGRFRATVRSDEENWIYGECGCAGGYDECPGHATRDEAQLAYRKAHLSDIRFAKDEEHQHKCVVCGAWTQNIAMIWGVSFGADFHLCDEHNTKEKVGELYLAKK